MKKTIKTKTLRLTTEKIATLIANAELTHVAGGQRVPVPSDGYTKCCTTNLGTTSSV